MPKKPAEKQKGIPSAQQVIKNISALFGKGHAYNDIAEGLNHAGTPAPRDGKWAATEVKRILANPIYSGMIVLGKTRTSFNPLGEHFYSEIIPPNEWEFCANPELEHYRIIEHDAFLRNQRRMYDIAQKSPSRGRPKGEYGPSILSGLLHSIDCGGQLVNGGSGKKRYFRCENRRKKKGRTRCQCETSILEDRFIPILSKICTEIIGKMGERCIGFLNKEILRYTKVEGDQTPGLTDQLIKVNRRKEALLGIYERSKEIGKVDVFSKYMDDVGDCEIKISELKHKIEFNRQVKEIAAKPMDLDVNSFKGHLSWLSDLIQKPKDVAETRTAIKSLLPKIDVRSTSYPGYEHLLVRINEIPGAMEPFIRNEYAFLRATGMDEYKDISAEHSSRSFLKTVYEDLSDTYKSDKSSYKFHPLFPANIELLVTRHSRKKMLKMQEMLAKSGQIDAWSVCTFGISRSSDGGKSDTLLVWYRTFLNNGITPDWFKSGDPCLHRMHKPANPVIHDSEPASSGGIAGETALPVSQDVKTGESTLIPEMIPCFINPGTFDPFNTEPIDFEAIYAQFEWPAEPIGGPVAICRLVTDSLFV